HGIFMTRVAFALGGKVLASLGGDLDGFDIRLWDAASGRLLQRLPGSAGARSLVISADGKWLLTDGPRLIDVATGKELRRFKGPTRPTGSVAFSPDGRTVAAVESDSGALFLWDAATGKELRRVQPPAAGGASVAFSADSKAVALANAGAAVRLWS